MISIEVNLEQPFNSVAPGIATVPVMIETLRGLVTIIANLLTNEIVPSPDALHRN